MSREPASKSGTESKTRIEVCSDCGDLSRRRFLKGVGGTILASAAGASLLSGRTLALARPVETKTSETYVANLFQTLTAEQRKLMCFPFDHQLRSHISNNWHIVEQDVGAIGKLYNADQQELIRLILKGVTSEDGYERFQKQMKDDDGGLERYTCAIFGEPGTSKFEFVLTGRHLTIRADGDSVGGTAFGGPIFYGHAVKFDEDPTHPGNVWWHQARLANDVFQALNGKQREKALLETAPPDDDTTVRLRGSSVGVPGISVSEMSADQKELLEKTLKSMLTMYRESDVKEAMSCLDAHGGLDALSLSFYKEGDLGADGIWDRWRVEGPGCAWYFRGSPHVHAWVRFAGGVA